MLPELPLKLREGAAQPGGKLLRSARIACNQGRLYAAGQLRRAPCAKAQAGTLERVCSPCDGHQVPVVAEGL